MAVITISRGTFSGGTMLGEHLSTKLEYRCITRDELVRRVAARGVSERDLHAALDRPPANVGGTLDHRKYIYLTLMQATLMDEILHDKMVYMGLAGHLLLNWGISVLRVRVVAPMRLRIRMAQEQMGVKRDEAVAYIQKMDGERHKWTRYLYGVEWEDPALYDIVVNLEHISVEAAGRMVESMVEEPAFALSAESRAALQDSVLASRVRAELAINPLTAHLEVDVKSRDGALSITEDLRDDEAAVRRVALEVPGVSALSCC